MAPRVVSPAGWLEGPPLPGVAGLQPVQPVLPRLHSNGRKRRDTETSSGSACLTRRNSLAASQPSCTENHGCGAHCNDKDLEELLRQVSPDSSPSRRLNSPRPSRAACTPRHKLQIKLGGTLGQLSLITVRAGLEPIRAPYCVTVYYDLRPVLGMLTGRETLYLAALDAERLRRRGAGTGLDAMQASESWIARDCICSTTGKLRPLTATKCPGEVKLSLCPSPVQSEGEACVLLRVVAIRHPQDPRDWYVLGSSVVLRVDIGGKLLQQGSHGCQVQWQQLRKPRAETADASERSRSSAEESTGAGGCPCCGLRLQQLLDFYDDIRGDVERYCASHRLCAHEGRYKSYHVCLHEPCPYRPINKARFDDHRGVAFVQRSALTEEETEKLEELVPDMHLIVRRYIWSSGGQNHNESRALVVDTTLPQKTGAYVSHCWVEPFAELLQTLQRAVDKEDVVFVPGLSLASGALIHGRSGGTGDLDQRPFATALHRAEKLLIVADRGLGFARCLWCFYEAAKAREWLLPTYLWPHHAADLLKLQEAMGSIDVSAASRAVPSATDAVTCAPEELRQRLAMAIQGAGPHPQAAEQLLRDFLRTRALCYAEALQQADDFRDFSPQRLRQLQAEHERKAVLRELGCEHARCMDEIEAMVEDRNREIVGEHIRLEAQTADCMAEAEKADCGRRELVAAAQAFAESQSALRHCHEQAEDRNSKTERQLEEAQASNAQLVLEVAHEQQRLHKECQHMEEARHITEQDHQLSMEDVFQRFEKEQNLSRQESEMREAAEEQRMATAELHSEAEERLQQMQVEYRLLQEKHEEVMEMMKKSEEESHDDCISITGSEVEKRRGLLGLSRGGNPLRLSLHSSESSDSTGVNAVSHLAGGMVNFFSHKRHPKQKTSALSHYSQGSAAGTSRLNMVGNSLTSLSGFAGGAARHLWSQKSTDSITEHFNDEALTLARKGSASTDEGSVRPTLERGASSASIM